ncbi:DUF4407 domain-containing protein [Rhodocaloribacter litoris]|uniref:SxtJ family membrane protein n=1 Tax=Rhodocaloribacter litoris TaxID=2558931 RepID=UPI001422D2DD|nr:SxtJ family membrane protein [Rhodocaloribacter litoris]QXD16338.1 DUF4407 domain-containing protein [Rhodocaloribacter litoris]
MLWDEIRGIEAGDRQVRAFGWLVGGVLVALALGLAWRRGWTPGALPVGLGVAGAVLALGGWLAPRLFRPLYRAWMGLALVLGFVMTRVVLTLVFYLVVTPIGLLLRLFGRDPLQRRRDPAASSYWIEKTYRDDTPRRLEKYF